MVDSFVLHTKTSVKLGAIFIIQKELNQHIKYLENLALSTVGASKYFIVKLALEELKNVYDQKQRLYKEMKNLDRLTVIKSYNLKDNENEMVHPVIKEYRSYNDSFLKTIKRVAELIRDLSDPEQEASTNKLKGIQSRIKATRGGKDEEK